MPQPLSKEFLLIRGYCCGNGCINCPYTPRHKKQNKMIKDLKDIPKELIKEISICGISLRIELKNNTILFYSHKDYKEYCDFMDKIKQNDTGKNNS